MRDKRRRLLFSPVEVESEINRIEDLHREKRGLIQQSISHRAMIPALEKTIPTKSTSTMSGSPKPPEKVESKAIVDGQRSARAATLFREGKSVIDVVIEMAIDFSVAHYYWEWYCFAQPAWLLPQKQFAKVRTLLNWIEDPATPEGFDVALQKFIAKEVARQVRETTGEPDPESENDDDDAE